MKKWVQVANNIINKPETVKCLKKWMANGTNLVCKRACALRTLFFDYYSQTVGPFCFSSLNLPHGFKDINNEASVIFLGKIMNTKLTGQAFVSCCQICGALASILKESENYTEVCVLILFLNICSMAKTWLHLIRNSWMENSTN